MAKTTLIDTDEVKKLVPILDTKTVLGALYTSGDGYINAQNLTLALAKGAEKRGAIVIEQCPKIKAVEEGKTDWVVKFDDGSQIRTRNIVNAAGDRIVVRLGKMILVWTFYKIHRSYFLNGGSSAKFHLIVIYNSIFHRL